MIESEIRKLASRTPDHALDRLEDDVWACVAVRERAQRASSRLLVLQAALAAIAFGACAVAGYRSTHSGQTPELSVFSTRSPLNASVLLAGGKP